MPRITYDPNRGFKSRKRRNDWMEQEGIRKAHWTKRNGRYYLRKDIKSKTEKTITRRDKAPTPGSRKEFSKGFQKRNPDQFPEPVKDTSPNPALAAAGLRQIPGGVETIPDRPTGFANIYEVMKALNPFNKERISLVNPGNNKIYNSALEYIANHPLMAASFALGGGVRYIGSKGLTSLAKLSNKKAVTGTILDKFSNTFPFAAGKASNVSVNTATAKASQSLMAGIAANLKKPAYVIAAVGAMIGTYPWAEWALGEAKEGMIFNAKKAIDTQDPEVMKEFQKTQDEIFDVNVWEQIARLTPGANIAYGFGQKAKALQAQYAVNNKIVVDNIKAIETGETEDQKFARIRQEKIDMEKTITDYYNQERLKIDAAIKESDRLDRERKRAEFKKSRAEDAAFNAQVREQIRQEEEEFARKQAAFWAEERRKQREREAADRKAIAEFWLAYDKASQKMRQNDTPSTLNFGLL